MAKLKNQQSQVPGGFKFYIPATKFSPTPFSSLDSIVMQVIQHRQGRPDLVAKFGWSLDPAIVRQEVEDYNVQICIQNGWRDYITGDEQSPPFQHRTNLLSKARAVAGGAEVLVDWWREGSPLVSQDLANKRGEICVGCPLNGQGGWETYFTVPVSNAIRREVGKKKAMKLETPSDDKLGVCTGCSCPLSLKLWMPIQNIVEKMPKEQRAALDPRCWILQESQ